MPRRRFDPQTAVPDLLAVVAYAELRAVMLAWAQTPCPEVHDLARAAMNHAITERLDESLVVVARDHVRRATADALASAAVRLGPWPWERRLARGQLGTLDGIERAFHLAGEQAAGVRARDARVLAVAVTLTDELHRLLGGRDNSAR